MIIFSRWPPLARIRLNPTIFRYRPEISIQEPHVQSPRISSPNPTDRPVNIWHSWPSSRFEIANFLNDETRIARAFRFFSAKNFAISAEMGNSIEAAIFAILDNLRPLCILSRRWGMPDSKCILKTHSLSRLRSLLIGPYNRVGLIWHIRNPPLVIRLVVERDAPVVFDADRL